VCLQVSIFYFVFVRLVACFQSPVSDLVVSVTTLYLLGLIVMCVMTLNLLGFHFVFVKFSGLCFDFVFVRFNEVYYLELEPLC
jgi:hypothetical protein